MSGHCRSFASLGRDGVVPVPRGMTLRCPTHGKLAEVAAVPYVGASGRAMHLRARCPRCESWVRPCWWVPRSSAGLEPRRADEL